MGKNLGRGRYTRRARYPFRGLIQCHHCGCAITADEQKGHSYYRCDKRRGPCRLKTIREEALPQHLRASIRLASIRDDGADAMLAEVEAWKLTDTARQAELLARHRADLARATDRLNHLLDVFIDGTITKEDFTSHKERLVQEKASLCDSVARMEVHGATRFKPLADFITASRQAKYDAETEGLEKLRNWHKKTGSNLLLAAAILSGGGGSWSADGQEAETDGSRSAGQSPSLTEGSSRNPIAGLRGGSAALADSSRHWEAGGESKDRGKQGAFESLGERRHGHGGGQAVGGQSVTCCSALLPKGLALAGRRLRQPILAATLAARIPVARLEDRSRVACPLPGPVVGRRGKSEKSKLAEREGFEPSIPG